jgi:hypothetical protein
VEIDSVASPWTFAPVTYQNLSLVGDMAEVHSGATTLNGLTLAQKVSSLPYSP